MSNRTTEEMKLATLRERLKEKCDSGLLGTVAARARVPEGVLYDWCMDARKVPSRSEVEDVNRVIAHEHYTDEAQAASQLELLENESTGFDPYNHSLPAFLRRQAD